MNRHWRLLSLLRRRCAAATESAASKNPPASIMYRSFHTTFPASVSVALEDVVVDPSSTTTTEILRPYFEAQQPGRLRQLLLGSEKTITAMKSWQHWDHFERTVDGHTPCHIEVGGNYSQSDLANVEFQDFLTYLRFFEEKYGRNSSEQSTRQDNHEQPQPGELMYLAQNDLFPELLQELEDAVPPRFCSELGQGHLYNTMIWMGPYGCVSPLHYDPLDNCLLQFVGQKQVWLCSPESAVEAGTQGCQPNTSSINPELLDDHNDGSGVKFYHTTLDPGDALYIPKKWYHYVRTTESSVSVNTWWR